MYRDESETHLDDDHSHNFSTAFLRNLRCSAVMNISVWVCQAAKNRLNYNTPWLPSNRVHWASRANGLAHAAFPSRIRDGETGETRAGTGMRNTLQMTKHICYM